MGRNGTTAVMALSFTAGFLLIIVTILFGMYWINSVEILQLDYLRIISDVWYVAGVEGFALLRTTIAIMLLLVGSAGAIIGAAAAYGVMTIAARAPRGGRRKASKANVSN